MDEETTDVATEPERPEAAEQAQPASDEMSLDDLRAEVERWRNKATDSIESRQKAKEKARGVESENRELKKRLADYEKAQQEERRSKLEAKEKYHELVAEMEAEREKLHGQIGAQLKNKQFEDLYSKVVTEGGLDPSNEFVIRATLSQIANDLDLIDDVDPSDIQTLTVREADKKSVGAALRQLRKLAPGFFNQSKAGGDIPQKEAAEKAQTLDGIPVPDGVSPDDPELARVLKAARGR